MAQKKSIKIITKTNFKNFEATNNKLENLTHKRNSIKIGFVPSLWLEHNLFSKEESYRRNNELCKILKNSINLKKIDVFVFLHPKQKLRDYLWIEKKYNFKLMKQNISHLICNLDLLYTGFSSGVIIWASEIKLDVLIANIYQEKNTVFKDFKNVKYANSISIIRHELSKLTKEKKLTNIKNIILKNVLVLLSNVILISFHIDRKFNTFYDYEW